MNDLKILSVEEFPSRELLKTLSLDIAAAIRSLVGNINMIRDIAMEILKKNYLSSIRLKYSSHVTPIKKIALKGESVWHGEAAIGIC